MRTVLWILVGTAVLAVVMAVFVGIQKLRTGVKRRRNRSAALAACNASPSARVPVFITMVCVGPAQVHGTLRSIQAALQHASCPLRVFVGVAEYTDSGPSVADRFTDVSRRSPVPFELADNIRLLRAPVAEFAGVNTAREQVQRYLYRAERYVLTLAPGVLLQPQWDVVLTAALQQQQQGRAVLTTSPGPRRSPSGLGTYLATASPRPSFGAFELKMPPEGVTEATVPAIAWTGDLSFSEGPLPLAGVAESLQPPQDEDVVMTARLLQTGWRLLHPVQGVAVWPARDAALYRDLRCRGHPVPAAPPVVPTAVLEGFGVKAGKVSHRGRLGIVGAGTPLELSLKVGSAGDVLSLLSRIELQNKRSATTQQTPTEGGPTHGRR